MITDHDVAQYHETGYLVVPDVIEPEMLGRLRAALDGLVADAASVSEHTDVYDLEPGHTPADPKVRRIKMPHSHTPVFWELAQHPRMVAIMNKLLGPSGARLQTSKINLKSPHYGSPVEWHQDWAFYPHTNDDLLAVGVAMDPMTMENGCLLVIPGSHKGPIVDHHSKSRGIFVGAVTDEDFTAAGAVPILLEAGGISIHHVRTLHGSAPNTSSNPRRLLLYQYCAIDAWPLMGFGSWDAFNATIVRGEPTRVARVTNVPVRMPVPAGEKGGSIYETQTMMEKRMYNVPAEKVLAR